MRTNTLVSYNMSAAYRTWEPEERAGGIFRRYNDPVEISCTLSLTPTGGIQLVTDQELQMFGVVESMKDAGGQAFMDTTWYTVNRVSPTFDAMGYLSSYRHMLSTLAPEVLGEPITPRVDYSEYFDQG